MKATKCPSEETIAHLAEGEIVGHERENLLRHIADCTSCRDLAKGYDELEAILSCLEVNENGDLVIEIPDPSPGFEEKVVETARKAFNQAEHRRKKLTTLLDRLIEELKQAIQEPAKEAVAVGYAATRPEEAVDEDLKNLVVSLLDTLLDPRVPVETRVARAKRLCEVLDECAEQEPQDGK